MLTPPVSISLPLGSFPSNCVLLTYSLFHLFITWDVINDDSYLQIFMTTLMVRVKIVLRFSVIIWTKTMSLRICLPLWSNWWIAYRQDFSWQESKGTWTKRIPMQANNWTKYQSPKWHRATTRRSTLSSSILEEDAFYLCLCLFIFVTFSVSSSWVSAVKEV